MAFILGQELKDYTNLNHPPQVVEKVAFEYNFSFWSVLWFLPSDFHQDWNTKDQWLQLILEDGSQGGINVATGSPAWPLSSSGNTKHNKFEHWFLPEVEHPSKAICGRVTTLQPVAAVPCTSWWLENGNCKQIV